MTNVSIFVGTSGWSYEHWVGPFYPEGTSSQDYLASYAQHFATVEINNTFYQLPSDETVADWRDRTPPGFLFACKASRYITHMKKLSDPERSAARFFAAVQLLGNKLGPVLFQLPPRWRVNVARLEAFLQAMPRGYRYAFEFRDESWFTPETYAVLTAHNAAFCIYDLAGRQSPEQLTADFVYVRLHGPAGAYAGRYGKQALRRWAKRCRTWARMGKVVYCYFNNDQAGYAPQDALTLQRLMA